MADFIRKVNIHGSPHVGAVPVRRIVMAGPLPPPIHGMAAVNAAVRDHLRLRGVEPVIIDLAAPTLERSFLARLGRLPKVLRGLIRLVATPGLRGKILYISVSGGLGQVYEILFVLVARLRGMRLYLHHHSYAYLVARNTFTRILISIAGKSARQITQSPIMVERLKSLYGAVSVLPISNAVFTLEDRRVVRRARQQIKTLGFISNIAEEKGIFEALDLMAVVSNEGLKIRGKVAGPFQDEKTRKKVLARLGLLPNIEHVGPIYGSEKAAFLSEIDVFVFPTRYANETEGLVNLEAMSRGIPVIAYGRGCIPEIVTPGCGKVIDPAEPFVPAALEQIKAWLNDPETFEAASRAAAERFTQLYEENEQRWRNLLAELLGRELPAGTTADNEKESLPSANSS